MLASCEGKHALLQIGEATSLLGGKRLAVQPEVGVPQRSDGFAQAFSRPCGRGRWVVHSMRQAGRNLAKAAVFATPLLRVTQRIRSAITATGPRPQLGKTLQHLREELLCQSGYAGSQNCAGSHRKDR